MATILIVDDQPINRQFLMKLLGHSAHRVLEAATGEDGLRIAHAEGPDLIITDILMPAMDGFEFVRRLRTDPPIAATPVIFYTAHYLQYEARALAQKCGVEHIILKPSEPAEVLRIVDTALGQISPLPVSSPDPAFEQQHVRLLTNKLSQQVNSLQLINQRLQALLDLGQRLAAESDPLHLLHICCHAAHTIIGAGAAAIGILDDDRQTLNRFVIHGPDVDDTMHLSAPSIEHGVIHMIIAERRPLRQINPSGAPEAFGLPADHPPVYAFLGVPIISAERIYGWLCLRNKRGADGFSAEDEQIAMTLAAQTAVTYENACRLAALQRSNTELEQFAYVASHDLQEPLRMVASYVQLLERRYRGQLDAKADMYIGYAVDGATRMQQLIQDLLAYSRAGRQDHQAPTDCTAVVRQVLKTLGATLAVCQATVTYDPLPVVMADATQLGHVFQNLISNAVKFHGSEPPTVHISAMRRDAAWVFAVRDNGIGIEPEYAERIFAIFQRLHTRAEYPGTGIGLAICKRIVEQHGGQIWVKSAAGEGATFYFSLPSMEGVYHEPAHSDPTN